MPAKKKRGRPKKKNGYDANYGFRCYRTLRLRAQRVATERGSGDESDIAREGTIQLVESEEKRLNLPPLETANRKAA